MIKPTGHHLLVEVEKVEEKSEGGIITTCDENQLKREFHGKTVGIVVAIGPMCWKAYDYDKPGWKEWCKVGDKIEFTSNTSKLIEDDDGNQLFLMVDENVLAVHEEDKDE